MSALHTPIAGALCSLALLGGLSWTGPGSTQAGAAARGQKLFENGAHCTVCHTIGSEEEGRGPDLGAIAARAEERAKTFGIEGPQAGLQYLLRALVRPADDVVEGFNPMPESWLPSELSNADLSDLLAYLGTLGAKPLEGQVALPSAWLDAKRADYAQELTLFELGDPKAGRKLFMDKSGNAGCIKCHTIDAEGADICPNLTLVNRVQRPTYVLHSVLDSSAFIVHGYRQLMIWDDSGTIHVGLPQEEDDEVITLVIDDNGTTEEVWKDEIEDQAFSDVSRMPGNFAELLSAKDVLNVVSFVLRHDTLKPAIAASTGTEGGAGKETALAPLTLTVMPTVTADETKYQMAFQEGDALTGSRIYAHYCTMCHGKDGTGTGFNAVNLETKPANHTDDRRMSKTDDRLLHGVITRGGLKTGRSVLMPPWGHTFDAREIWDLVAYLRTLHADVAHARP